MSTAAVERPRFDPAALRRALALRGLSGADLARLAHLSPPTVSQAVNGRPVAPRTFTAIVRALGTSHPLPGSTELLADAAGTSTIPTVTSATPTTGPTTDDDNHPTPAA